MHESYRRGFEKKADAATAAVCDAGIGANFKDPTRGQRKPGLDTMDDEKHYSQNQPTRL